jgi:hypothetical protein
MPFSLQSLFNKLIHLSPWLLKIGLSFFNATFAASWVILVPLLPLELLPALT